MIERYSRKEIKYIWEDHNRYSLWLDIEIAAAEAMEKLKISPRGIAKKVKLKAKINPKRILQIESKVKHDIIAFLTSITEPKTLDIWVMHTIFVFDEIFVLIISNEIWPFSSGSTQISFMPFLALKKCQGTMLA